MVAAFHLLITIIEVGDIDKNTPSHFAAHQEEHENVRRQRLSERRNARRSHWSAHCNIAFIAPI